MLQTGTISSSDIAFLACSDLLALADPDAEIRIAPRTATGSYPKLCQAAFFHSRIMPVKVHPMFFVEF